MDVRCERCKTEYEFDDARITEAGVTVKCTQCSHVFKVKKKALVVTVPVKSDEGGHVELPPAQPAPAGPEKPREWKVRQGSGNIFSFRELTTLQKWIVERKVSRDDQISVTGETWKRLGDIGELAAFFQVVDDAQRAAQLQALQAAQAQLPTSAAPSPSRPPAPPAVPVSSFVPAEPPPSPAPAPDEPEPPAPAPAPVAPPPRPLAPPVITAPTAAAPAPKAPVRSAMRPETERRSGSAGLAIGALVVLALLGAGGYFGYTQVWLPREQQRKDAELATAQAAAEQARLQQAQAQAQAQAQREAEAKKAADEAAEKQKAEQAAVAAPDAGTPVDAGTVAAVDPVVPAKTEVAPEPKKPAPTPEKPVAAAKKEPVRDFDWYVNQGDRLREREKYESALDAYGNASDLQPDRVEPVTGRALVLLDMGQKLQAEAQFLQALKLNPRYAVAAMGLAETYRSLGKKDEAIRYYERYLELLPNGPEANVARTALERLKN